MARTSESITTRYHKFNVGDTVKIRNSAIGDNRGTWGVIHRVGELVTEEQGFMYSITICDSLVFPELIGCDMGYWENEIKYV